MKNDEKGRGKHPTPKKGNAVHRLLTTDHRLLKRQNDEDVRESGQNRLAGRVEPNRPELPLGYPEATLRLSGSQPVATRKPP
jgi:hypothetical protein